MITNHWRCKFEIVGGWRQEQRPTPEAASGSCPEVGFEEIKNQRSASVALTLAKNARVGSRITERPKGGQPPLTQRSVKQ